MRVRLIAVLAVLSLVALACSNSSDTASSTSTTGGSSGGTGGEPARRDQGHDPRRRGGVQDQHPQRPVRVRVRRGQGVLQHGQHRGRHLQAQARAGLRARRPDGPEPAAGRGAPGAGQRVCSATRSRRSFLFSGAQTLADQKDPDVRLEHQRRVHRHPTLFFGSNFGAPRLGCVGSVQPFVASSSAERRSGVLA